MQTKKRVHELGQIIVVVETYILHKNKVLMHKRSNDKKKFPGFWTGPGGHVDFDEDILKAAIREIQEEAGVLVNSNQINLKGVALHNHLDRQEVYIVYIFLANIPESQASRSTNEGKSAWIDIDELKNLDNIFPPAKFYFDHVLNNKPGILYTNIEWQNSKLVRVLSQSIDRDN